VPRPQDDRRGHSPRAVRKRESIQYLKDALAGDRLTVLFQPIVDARTTRPVAAEALLRWRRPRQEAHDLTHLLGAAERSPVIHALERWVVEACGAAVPIWQRGALDAVRVNVNLSAREFGGPRLQARLAAVFRRSELDPARVTLEVTETSTIEPAAASPVLESLRDEGFQVWLDDFGTGHSSLEWLLRLPADGVKIPATFVRALPGNERAVAIVTAVIDLAHHLGLRVTAEGVEGEEQRRWLARAGCDQLQGYLFYAAMPASVLARRLGPR
jgi:diguanylate cyclase